MRMLVCTEAGNLECIAVKDASIPEPGDHLVTLKEMAEAGKIRSYIEKTFLPQDAKAEFKRICKDHAKGKNVIYFGSII